MTHAIKTHSRTTLARSSRSRTSRSLRSAAALGLGLLSLLSLSAGTVAYAGTVNWDSTPGDWFANPSHWDNGAYPGATDDAVNMSTAAMTLGQSTTINSFFSNGAFTLQGGTFSGNRANAASLLTVNNVFTDDGGQINNFTVNQGTGGSVVFTGNGGNSLLNTTINSSMDLATNANAYLNINGVNTVNGAITLGTTSNGLHLQDGNANLILSNTGSLTGFGTVYQGGGGATLTSNGTINADVSKQALNITNDNFVNTGTAEATNGGTLSLNNSITGGDGSAFTATGTGSLLTLAGTYNGIGSALFAASKGGQIQVNGATLLGTINTDAGTALVFNGSGGNSAVNATVNGNLDLAANTAAYLNINGVNTVNGAISLGTTSNGLHLQDGNANLILGSGGSLTGFGTVYQGGGQATLTNNGTINATGGTLAITNDNFANTGTAEATNGGILTLAGNTTTTNSGLLSAANGGVLDISGTFNSNAGNSINSVGGTINVLGGTNLNGTLNETSGSTLVLDNNGKNFNSTTVNGNLDMATNAAAYANIAGVNTFNGVTILGTTSNGLHLQDGNTNLINNGSLVGFGTVYQGGGQATLTNNGTINATGGTLAITNDNFANTGTAEATKGGILTLAGNTTNSGLLAATNGGVLDISGSLYSNTGNSINGVGGTINVLGANLYGTINETSGTTLVLDKSGKNFNSTTVNGNLDMATNLNAYANFAGNNTVNGAITLGTTSNGLHLQDGNTNLILSGTGSLVGFGTVYQGGGQATLTNNGTINAGVSKQALNITNDNFANTGTAEATNGGILTLAGNTTTNNSGTLAATGGGILDISGTLNSSLSSSLNSVGGTINVLGANLYGTLNETSGTTLVLDNSGKTFHSTTVNGNLDLATNTAAFVNFDGINTVNGQINLGTTSNGLHLQDGNTNLILGSGGSLTGFGTVYQGGGQATLTNNGTINATGGTLAITNDNFANTGTAEATNGGILTLAGNTTTTNTGALTATNGGIISIAGSFTSSGSNLISAMNGGQVQVGSANLYGTINEASGTALILDGSGKTFHSTTVNGGLDLSTNTNAYVNFDGVNTVNGAISLGTTSNGLHLQDGNANLILSNTGSLVGFGTVYQGGGQATLTNNGTINATGGTLAITNDNFANTGTVQVQNGAALSVTSANTDSGNILVKQGGTATFTQGLTQTAGLTQVDGTLSSPLTLTGGTLAGTGAVNGNVANSGGTVSAGNAASPFGTLAVNGAFSQGAGGALDVGFSSTQSSLLAVSGAVTTGGMLNVSYLGAGPYTGSGPFTFLDYGSLLSSITGTGPTQYFSNETFDPAGNGLIAGSNGFLYELINNTGANSLQLEVLRNGAPTPAVPEASTTVSMGLLLLLGGGGLLIAKRRRTAAAQVTAS